MQPGPEGGLGGDQNRLDRHPSAALRLDHGDAETAVRQLHDDHSFSEYTWLNDAPGVRRLSDTGSSGGMNPRARRRSSWAILGAILASNRPPGSGPNGGPPPARRGPAK